MFTYIPHLAADFATVLPAQGIPPVEPAPLPGGAGEAVQYVVGALITLAGLSAVGLFFFGISWVGIGRFTDHHGSGRQGTKLILAALVCAVLWGLGQPLVNAFATQNFGN